MEGGGAKFRLVRCPKCEKLLPELPDYSVYRCGGCDATLQAKKLASVDVEKFEEEPVREGGKVSSDEAGTSSNEREDLGSDDKFEFREKESFFHEKTAISNENEVSDFYTNGGDFQDYSSDRGFGYSRFNPGDKDCLSSVDNKNRFEVKSCEKEEIATAQKVVQNTVRSVGDSETHEKEKVINFHGKNRSTNGCVGKSHGFESRVTRDSSEGNSEMVSRGYGNVVETESGYDGGRFTFPSKMPNKNWVDQEEVIRSNLEDRETKGKPENLHEFQKFQQGRSWGALESNGGCWRNNDGQVRKRRAVQGLLHPDEGPSNYHESSYGYGDQVFGQNLHGHDRVEYLEEDPMALLTKLDELREQLSKSCNVSDKSKGNIPVNGRMVPNSSYFQNNWEASSGFSRTSRQILPWSNQAQRSKYCNHEPVAPLMDRHDVDLPHFYPVKHTKKEILGEARDQFGARILQTTSPSHQNYSQRPVGVNGFGGNHRNDYLPRQYVDVDPEPCLSCYNKQFQVQKQGIHGAPNDHSFCHHRGPSSFGSHDYTGSDAPLHPHESNSHMRRFRNHKSEFNFRKWHPQRTMHNTKGTKRYCQPLTGGAPFITCNNCFELLQLPKKFLLMKRNSHKLRCGACFQVISFSFNGNRLIFSTPAHNRHPTSGLDTRSDEMGAINYSEDYNMSSYNIQSSEAEPIFSSSPLVNNCGMRKESASTHILEHMVGQSKFNGSEKMQDYSLSSTSSEDEDEDEDDGDGLGSQREEPEPEELPLRVNQVAPSLGSLPHGRFGFSSSNEMVTKFEKGSRSKRSDGRGALVPSKITVKQNSVKDASVATEMDFSLPTDLDSGIYQDLLEVTKEDQPKIIKASESSFVGFIKKSFGDFTRSNQSLENGKCNVSVNCKPLPCRLVKKAAKQAGPIHPGEYWYDYRAGFWGVMGYQCLGIIPPFIEEFSYPMPKNCSGGNTGVLVNGRELHQIDLDKLAGRGLPITRDKSYIIEITGTVMDEASGKELDGLGKLAPTVEKEKRGFGMWVPREITESKTPPTVSAS